MFESDESVDRRSLTQGDVLQRTDTLLSAIREAHPYYADAVDYEFFMVLTQSCDLVRRGKKRPKTSYITIAAVRPFGVLVDRILSRVEEPLEGWPIPLCRKQDEAWVRNLLERVMHNTAEGYFCLKQGCHPTLPKHYCTFLSLSVALRVDHYEACLEAKIAQLKDIFQAKLGWLTGNLYSRIGTPEEQGDPVALRDEFLSDVLYQRSIWVTPEQRREIAAQSKASPPKTEEDAHQLVDNIKDDTQILAERITTILSDVMKDREARTAIANRITSDRVIGRIVRK